MAQAEALVAQMKRAELIPDATWRWRGLQKTAGGLAFLGGNLFVVGFKEKPKENRCSILGVPTSQKIEGKLEVPGTVGMM